MFIETVLFANMINLTKNKNFTTHYDIHVCKRCNSEFVNPVPNYDAISDYYNNCKCNILLSNRIKERHKVHSHFIRWDVFQEI